MVTFEEKTFKMLDEGNKFEIESGCSSSLDIR